MVEQTKAPGQNYVVGAAQVGSPGLMQVPPRSAQNYIVGAAQVGSPGLSQIPAQPKVAEQ